MERLVAGRERIYLDRFWNEFAGDPSKVDKATRRHYAAIYARPGAMHSAFAQFLAIDQKDAADNLEAMQTKLTMPVLAIGAEKAFGANVAVVMRNAATNVPELVVPNAADGGSARGDDRRGAGLPRSALSPAAPSLRPPPLFGGLSVALCGRGRIANQPRHGARGALAASHLHRHDDG